MWNVFFWRVSRRLKKSRETRNDNDCENHAVRQIMALNNLVSTKQKELSKYLPQVCQTDFYQSSDWTPDQTLPGLSAGLLLRTTSLLSNVLWPQQQVLRSVKVLDWRPSLPTGLLKLLSAGLLKSEPSLSGRFESVLNQRVSRRTKKFPPDRRVPGQRVPGQRIPAGQTSSRTTSSQTTSFRTTSSRTTSSRRTKKFPTRTTDRVSDHVFYQVQSF